MKRRIIVTAAAAAMCISLAAGVSAEPYLTDTSVTVGVGETTYVRLMGFTGKTKWKTGNKRVFKFSDGVVTGVGVGTSTLTAYNDGHTYECKVTVTEEGSGSSYDDDGSGNIWSAGSDGQSSAYEPSIWSEYLTSDYTIAAGEALTVSVNVDDTEIVVRSDGPGIVGMKLGAVEDGVLPVTVTGLSDGRACISVYSRYDTEEPIDSFSVLIKGGTPVKKTTSSTDIEMQVFELINAEREAHGLDPYIYDGDIGGYADIRAVELSTKFSHTRPDGTHGVDMITDGGYTGENVAKGYKTAKGVFNGWMNSKGHRANLLSSKFTRVGIGYDKSSRCWVILFSD